VSGAAVVRDGGLNDSNRPATIEVKFRLTPFLVYVLELMAQFVRLSGRGEDFFCDSEKWANEALEVALQEAFEDATFGRMKLGHLKHGFDQGERMTFRRVLNDKFEIDRVELVALHVAPCMECGAIVAVDSMNCGGQCRVCDPRPGAVN
jgi:hypothetical protein